MDQVVEDIGRIVGGHTPAIQVEVTVTLGEQRIVQGERPCLDRDLDADARQEACHGGGDGLVVHVAIIGCIQREREALGVTGFGQQLASARRICLGIGGQSLGVAIDERCRQHAGGTGEPTHHGFLDGITIDGQRQRLAHPGICQRVAVGDRGMTQLGCPHVEPQEDGAVLEPAGHLQIGVGLEAGHVLGRHVLQEVDLAGQQGRHPGRGRLDGHIGELGDLQRELALAPVGGVELHDRARIHLTRDQRVRASAVHVARGVVLGF